MGFPVTDPNEDAPDGAVVDGHERHGDSWEPLPKGTKVSLDVTWPNGRTSRMHGVLIHVHKEEAFVETDLGCVVGPAESLEVDV